MHKSLYQIMEDEGLFLVDVLPPGTQVKTFDDSGSAASDSRILIAWK
jgi:hypothetical protein